MRRTASVLLLAFLPVQVLAQAITPKGSPNTLEVATWNIEWFGSASNGPSDDPRQIRNVGAVIGQSDIDLWGVQEISDATDFEQVLDSLGEDYDGFLATNSGTQRVGFIFRTETIQARRVQHILEQHAFAFAGRPPLLLEATVTLPDTSFVATFITVHMKAGGGTDDRERRVQAALRLKNFLDFTTLSSEPVMILGDLNDELNRSITSGLPSPYSAFIQDTSRYFFPSFTLDDQNVPTFCGSNPVCTNGSTVDHILVTNEFAPFYVPGSADRYAELLSEVPGFVLNTSDHLPVFARFNFRKPVASPASADISPEAAALHPAYPNPFSISTRVRYRLDKASPVTIQVYDPMGRLVARLLDAVQPVGLHEFDLEAARLPADGLYLLRITTLERTSTQHLVLLR